MCERLLSNNTKLILIGIASDGDYVLFNQHWKGYKVPKKNFNETSNQMILSDSYKFEANQLFPALNRFNFEFNNEQVNFAFMFSSFFSQFLAIVTDKKRYQFKDRNVSESMLFQSTEHNNKHKHINNIVTLSMFNNKYVQNVVSVQNKQKKFCLFEPEEMITQHMYVNW